MWISKVKLQEIRETEALVFKRDIEAYRKRIEELTKPATIFKVHFDVLIHNKQGSEALTQISRVFEYASMERAQEAVRQLKESYKISLPAQEKNVETGIIEGFFDLVESKDVVFVDVWITHEVR